MAILLRHTNIFIIKNNLYMDIFNIDIIYNQMLVRMAKVIVFLKNLVKPT